MKTYVANLTHTVAGDTVGFTISFKAESRRAAKRIVLAHFVGFVAVEVAEKDWRKTDGTGHPTE